MYQMNRDQIKTTINKAEADFEKCFKTLAKVKRYIVQPAQGIGEELLDFQKILAERLFSIENTRRTIIREQKKMHTRKKHVSAKWYARRLKTLKNYNAALVQCSNIGKAIGDAFVWLFYAGERKLINEHLKQPPIPPMPIGIGGIGELKFITEAPNIEGHLTIYHGITNLLRLGDVSFVDLKTLKVFAIGEIKTKPTGEGQLTVLVKSVGLKSRGFDDRKIQKTTKLEKPIHFDKKFDENLQKQLRNISTSLKNTEKKSRKSTKFVGDYIFNDVESCVKNSKRRILTHCKASDGLLLGCYRTTKRSLFAKLMSEEVDFKIDSEDLMEYVNQVSDSTLPHNCLLHGSILYDAKGAALSRIGTSPPFWGNLKIETLKEMYFKDVIVYSLFNPVYLFESLEKLGIEITGKKGKWFANKKDDKVDFRFEGFSYFISLITDHLQHESTVYETIKTFLNKVESEEIKISGRANLDFFQYFDILPLKKRVD